MNDEKNDYLWEQILLALDLGNEAHAISLSKELSDAGDYRGSDTLGYIYWKKARSISIVSGNIDRESYITAAYWYNVALSQGGEFASHYGLATYYFYGLGDRYDFKLAYEHLKYCIEYIFPDQINSDAVINNVAQTQIMMAELLFLGLGTPKDVNAARKLFLEAAQVGYPAAVFGLSRIEIAEKHYIKAIQNFFRGLRMSIKLVIENKNHPLLSGIGGKYLNFRRDRLRDMGSRADQADLIIISEQHHQNSKWPKNP